MSIGEWSKCSLEVLFGGKEILGGLTSTENDIPLGYFDSIRKINKSIYLFYDLKHNEKLIRLIKKQHKAVCCKLIPMLWLPFLLSI
jgi:hypothetical protein